jgi:mannose-6-phosphate isomerase
MSVAPVLLGVNAPADRPYRGGLGISRFRRIAPLDERNPEDFVGSTTEVYSGDGVGLTRLEDGGLLRDAIAADPIAWLGPEQVAAHGDAPALLVKLLDTRERLFVHYHPDDAFAGEVLHRHRGKTEAWAIVATDGPAEAHLGFAREVAEAELLDWFTRQDADAMLAAMNRVELAPGDTLFVPAGLVHAIGAGITLVELQQPVDLSIILEWDGFPGLDLDSALLGLDPAVAVHGVDRSRCTPERLAQLRSSRIGEAGTESLFPAEADRYFRAERSRGNATWEPDFAVVIALAGRGALRWDGGELALAAGATALVPWGAGTIEVAGELELIRCRPPRA